MARMIPVLNGERLADLQSRAEARFYEACRDQLPNDFLVIYSASWLYRDDRGRINEGEADFTIVSPDLGILVVEVKGGGVTFNPSSGLWHSVDRTGRANPIKDPFKQAQSERHALLSQITGHASWKQFSGSQFPLGHAVVFPDINNATQLLGPDRQREFIGISSDLTDLTTWLRRAMRFWQRSSDSPLGARGARVVEDILCSPIDVRAVLRVAVEQAEERRIRLTAEQAKVLRTLGGRRRAVVSGGAGTGKTLLAVEKAKQLASDGLDVLLLCYNRPLADSLARNLQGSPRISARSFHQLCDQRVAAAAQAGHDLIKEARDAYPEPSSEAYFATHLPYALALSADILPEKFDALVIDEAQDFSDEYWFGLEMLLRDQANGYFYIFVDENQTVYPRKGKLPIEEEPYHLTSNCRNTAQIHEAGYRFYRGEAVDLPDIHGLEVKWATAESEEAQADAICRQVRHWVGDDGLEAHDAAVLLAKQPKSRCYELLQPRLVAASIQHVIESHGVGGSVLLDTFSRFKGLEAQAVVLWLGDEVIDAKTWETVYVGATRAKSLLTVVGTNRALTAVRQFAQAA